MADRIGVMRDGRMVQVGTPAAVYEHPNCRFVAEFLGAANILPGVAADGRVDLLGLGVVAAPGTASGPILLALRPERLRLGGGGANRLTATMMGSVYAGETMTQTVRLADGTDMRIAQSLHDGLTASPIPGATVVVSWSPEACIVLPP